MTTVNEHTALENTRVVGVTRLISPVVIKQEIPGDESIYAVVSKGRETISRILHGADKRFMAIVGPCSIHDPEGALEYARRLVELRKHLSPSIYVIMRVYFEKPRTTVGWKGLINDPKLDDSCDMVTGLYTARKLLLEMNKYFEMVLP